MVAGDGRRLNAGQRRDSFEQRRVELVHLLEVGPELEVHRVSSGRQLKFRLEHA
jgi:hypothetical protein